MLCATCLIYSEKHKFRKCFSASRIRSSSNVTIAEELSGLIFYFLFNNSFADRIESSDLLTEYAYFLAPGGILYTITDVKELYEWHVAKCTQHPCFQRLSEAEMVRWSVHADDVT